MITFDVLVIFFVFSSLSRSTFQKQIVPPNSSTSPMWQQAWKIKFFIDSNCNCNYCCFLHIAFLCVRQFKISSHQLLDRFSSVWFFLSVVCHIYYKCINNNSNRGSNSHTNNRSSSSSNSSNNNSNKSSSSSATWKPIISLLIEVFRSSTL